MAKTVSDIQVSVRWESRDENFSLITTNGLSILNRSYRKLASLVDWPELSRTDASRTTTADQESVTWPAVKFAKVKSVEMQNPLNNSKYELIVPARTEQEWVLARAKPSGFPEVYRRWHDGTQNVVQFAPAPDTVSLAVRINGVIEPTELTAAATETVFIDDIADDVLSLMISANILSKRNQTERAAELLNVAAGAISKLTEKEFVAADLDTEVARNG